MSIKSRFWAKVNTNGPSPKFDPSLGPCWLWTAYIAKNGYGRFNANGSPEWAHRVSYRISGLKIPRGLELDHLCRVRNCVRPSHLEPVTNRENSLRGESVSAKNARKTHCINGHAFVGANVYFRPGPNKKRDCRKCKQDARARFIGRLGAVSAAMIDAANPPETLCSDCGFSGDYHSDEGKCMNACSRRMIRERALNEDEPGYYSLDK